MPKLIVIFALIFFQTSTAQELKMYTNWEETKEIAEKEEKEILIILTGSEWCAPCKKMDKNVIAAREFQEYAHKNLVIFLVDLPGGGLHLNSKVYQTYAKFKKDYSAERLPSLVLAERDGKKIKTLTGKMFKLDNVLDQLNTARHEN